MVLNPLPRMSLFQWLTMGQKGYWWYPDTEICFKKKEHCFKGIPSLYQYLWDPGSLDWQYVKCFTNTLRTCTYDKHLGRTCAAFEEPSSQEGTRPPSIQWKLRETSWARWVLALGSAVCCTEFTDASIPGTSKNAWPLWHTRESQASVGFSGAEPGKRKDGFWILSLKENLGRGVN